MQGQLVCHGCRNMLMYPRGATQIRCALCNTINPPPQGMDMAHIICGGCQNMLVYTHGASSVICSCCQTINLVQVPHAAPSSQAGHVNCGHCRATLMYPYGVSSVRCAVCQYYTIVHTSNGRVPLSVNRSNGTTSPSTMPSSSVVTTQTVVVENPMSIDESGKLVSNVVVGVPTSRK